jgi:ABC-type sugar transport system permease subunit
MLNRIGYAAALATVLTLIILIISLLIRRYQRHGVEEDA